MTIKKGEVWGSPGRLPADGVLVRTNAEAHAVVNDALKAGQPVPPLGLLGGDLARSVGATGNEPRLRSSDARQLPVDLGILTAGERTFGFIAHAVIRHHLWRGRFVAAMNCDFLGPLKLAPRGHPNDGLLDVLDGRLSFDDRLKARRLARTGEHLPHPDINLRRVPEVHVELDRPTPLWVDGVRHGRVRRFTIRIEPDAVLGVV